MEDVYTIKVRTKPDTRNLYPSERRYSASTVSGLAWVHIALAATSFLLACLAIVNPNNEQIKRLDLKDVEQKTVGKNEFLYDLTLETTTEAVENITDTVVSAATDANNYILVIAPSLLTVFALAAGLASIMASVRWYIDRNITWLFIMSILSTLFSFVSFVLIAVWFVNTSDGKDDIAEFYKDKVPFSDVFVIKHSDVIDRNESHIVIAKNSTLSSDDNTSHLFSKRVLCINILIAAFLELLWSILSVKISYKGMKSNYKDGSERRGNCISVVTKIKGNNTKQSPRNGKLIAQKPDLIDRYPNKKIKRIFLANGDNGFYLKNQNDNDKCAKGNTDTTSEFYKERMMNFLNRCASLDGMSNPDIPASVQSECHLNPIPEGVVVNDLDKRDNKEIEASRDRMTPISWGDSPNHTIYNQNTLNLEKIFRIGAKLNQDGRREAKESDKQPTEEASEINENNLVKREVSEIR